MAIDEKTAKEEFDRDGFVVFAGFLSEEEVARIDAALKRYVEEVVPTLPRGEAMFDTRGNARMPKNLSNMQRFDPFFAYLLNDPRMLKLARTLLGDEPIPQHISHLNKAPRIGTESVPHQDGAYGNLVPNEGLTIWIPLDRADEGNGCMYYVRGSHRKGLLPHRDSDVLGFSLVLDGYDDEYRKLEAPLIVDPGDVAAHHMLTVHRAEANHSDRPRRAFVLLYYAARAKEDEEASNARRGRVLSKLAAEGKI